MIRARDESGVALLLVLLVITLLTITVVEFTYSAQVETRLARGARNALQAYYLARSGVNLAEAILIRDDELSSTVDSELDIWAQPLPPLPLGDGTIMLRVRDEARFLNVNALAKPSYQASVERPVFAQLFSLLGLDPRIRSAMIDWLDTDQEPEQSPAGAEQPFYLGQRPPVTVLDGAIVDLRELLGVRGMTPEILSRLSNFVTVIPGDKNEKKLRVNLNTAPAEVLMALSPALATDPGTIERLLNARTQVALESCEDLDEVAPRARELLRKDRLDCEADGVLQVYSTYFRIEAVGTVARISRGITTMVKRDDRGITRVTWSPRVSQLVLTTLPPSDFLEALPPLGGG